MQSSIKRYKNSIIDKAHNVQYDIYSNRKLNKAQMLLQIRFYFVNNDFKYPESGTKINIIAED